MLAARSKLVLWTAVGLVLPISSMAAYCCGVPAFGNDNTAPELSACRQRLSSSLVCPVDGRVCGPGVSCAASCDLPTSPMSVGCELSLRRAVCAYHFPECVTDNVVLSYEVDETNGKVMECPCSSPAGVCLNTCNQVEAFCNMSIDEVTVVPNCVGRNFGCTSEASRIRAAGGLYSGVSFLASAAAVVAAFIVSASRE